MSSPSQSIASEETSTPRSREDGRSFCTDFRARCAACGRAVTGGELRFLGEFLQFFDDRRAARQPKRQTGADIVVEDEKLQFLAELAMVALLRFLEHGEVFVELRLVLEGGAVDALELRVLLVAFVVGAGDVGELERADVSRAHDVRAGAEIDELAVAIERDRFARRNVFDDIELELARSVRAHLAPRAVRFSPCRVLHRAKLPSVRTDGSL